jgi:hypothetical protein
MSSLDQVHQQAAESPDLRNEADHAWKQKRRQIGGTVRVLLASPSLSVTLSIDEILRPSCV